MTTGPIPISCWPACAKKRRNRPAASSRSSLALRLVWAKPTPCSRPRTPGLKEGVDVVVGWVDTHGRAETEALLAELEVLPRRSVAYRGTTLEAFDLDAALARRPALLLVDELAHTNAPGSRHAKRWQDVEELLDAGIDVYTTVNVQHLESLNDVVAQITGVLVRETVPDSILDQADEVELIDLPP